MTKKKKEKEVLTFLNYIQNCLIRERKYRAINEILEYLSKNIKLIIKLKTLKLITLYIYQNTEYKDEFNELCLHYWLYCTKHKHKLEQI